MKMKHFVTAGLLGLAASFPAQLVAQDADHLQVKGGLVLVPRGPVHGLTGTTTGRTFEAGYYLVNAGDLGLDLMPYVGTFKIDGHDSSITTGEYFTLSSWRFGLDMVWYKGQIANVPVSFRTGPVMHTFIAQSTLSAANSLTNKEWKAGWRVGFDVSIPKTKWFASLELTASEWRSESKQTKVQNINPNNPFYGSLVAGYRF
jgi:hypothetical protein